MLLIQLSQLAHQTPDPGRLVRVGLCVVLLATGLAVSAQDDDSGDDPESVGFKVIVHSDNPIAELETDAVVKMFRKKIRRWDHGVPVVPVDLKADSPVREAFTRSVHNKSVTAIESFWQRMIFSGRDTPPEEKTTEDAVLAFVRANPGAIGYVSADKELGDGAKEVTLTP